MDLRIFVESFCQKERTLEVCSEKKTLIFKTFQYALLFVCLLAFNQIATASDAYFLVNDANPNYESAKQFLFKCRAQIWYKLRKMNLKVLFFDAKQINRCLSAF